MPRVENAIVKYLDAPKEGKKMWDMKTEDGTKFKVPARYVEHFQQGNPAPPFDYDEEQVPGTQFRFNSIKSVQASPKQHPEQRPASSSAPPKTNGSNGHATKDEIIWTLAFYKSAFESQQASVNQDFEELVDIGERSKALFHRLFP